MCKALCGCASVHPLSVWTPCLALSSFCTGSKPWSLLMWLKSIFASLLFWLEHTFDAFLSCLLKYIPPLFCRILTNFLLKTGEVPLMVDSARKELECPICMEVMMPPARIWQCKVGFFVVVFELKYFQDGICKNLAVHCYLDPTCLKCKSWRWRWIGSCCWPRWLTRHLWDGFRFIAQFYIEFDLAIPHICHFFTQAKFLENKIYIEIYTVNCQFTQ